MGAACQPWRLLEEFLLLRACLAALFALGIWTLLLCPCIFQLILAFGCCLWSTAYWIFREILRALHSGYMLLEGFGRIYIFSTLR